MVPVWRNLVEDVLVPVILRGRGGVFLCLPIYHDIFYIREFDYVRISSVRR